MPLTRPRAFTCRERADAVGSARGASAPGQRTGRGSVRHEKRVQELHARRRRAEQVAPCEFGVGALRHPAIAVSILALTCLAGAFLGISLREGYFASHENTTPQIKLTQQAKDLAPAQYLKLALVQMALEDAGVPAAENDAIVQRIIAEVRSVRSTRAVTPAEEREFLTTVENLHETLSRLGEDLERAQLQLEGEDEVQLKDPDRAGKAPDALMKLNVATATASLARISQTLDAAEAAAEEVAATVRDSTAPSMDLVLAVIAMYKESATEPTDVAAGLTQPRGRRLTVRPHIRR